MDEALTKVDPINKEGHLRDLVDEASKIDNSNSPPPDNVITNQNGVVDLDSVAILNFNLILIKIINVADLNAPVGGPDVFKDWKNDGIIGVSTKINALRVSVDTGEGGHLTSVKVLNVEYVTIIVLDNPDTAVTSAPAGLANSATAKFSFIASRSSLTFQCKLDNGDYSSCTSPREYQNLADDDHTFCVAATDAAGNTDPEPACYTWTVDTTAPETTISNPPLNLSGSNSASFSFASNENGSTFQCNRDNGVYNSCTSPTNYNNLADGSHTFCVAATDAAGNTDPSPACPTWTVDTTPPDTTIAAGKPSNPSNSGTASFSFTSTESGSTFECRIDGGGWSGCTSPKDYSGLGDGSHTFEVRATDTVGNTDSSPANYTWTINTDTTPPATAALPAGGTYATAQSVTLTCSDGTGSGCDKIYYTTDGSTPTKTSAIYSGAINIIASSTLKFFATDKAGNSEAVKTEAYTITGDTIPPLNTTGSNFINAGKQATNTSIVTLSLSATDNVGVTAYFVAENDTAIPPAPPAANDSGWISIPPTTAYSADELYTFKGNYVSGTDVYLYVWFKDQAGNISRSLSTEFFDDFESGTLNNWTIGGRKQGTYVADLVFRNGSNRAHLYHKDFTEVTLEKTFGFNPDMSFSFEMETDVSAQSSSTSDFYASSGVSFTFIDSSGTVIGWVAYLKSTSSFPFGVQCTSVPCQRNRIYDVGNKSYNFTMSDLLNQISISPNAINSVHVQFNSYASGWPYNMSGNVWFDNFRVANMADVWDSITYDINPPDTIITGQPSDPSNSSSAGFSFTCSETGSTFECQIDGGGWSSCNSPKDYTGLTDGSHTFDVRCTDAAGNTDLSPASYTWTVDTIAPINTTGTNFINGGAPYTNSTLVTLTISATDNVGVTGYYASENSTAPAASTPGWTSITSTTSYSASVPFTLSAGDETKTVYVWFKDAAGNVSASKSDTIILDTTPPDTSITGQPSDPSNSSSAAFSFTCSETGSTFECQIDGGGWSSCTSPKDYTGLTDVRHTFEVRCTDAAGNTDLSPASYTWTVDTIPPETTITGKPVDPSNSNTACFDFKSSEVVGSTFECRLYGGALSSCSSPKCYAGLSDGSHTFEVQAADAAGNIDPTPANYTWTINTSDTIPPVNTTSGGFINGGAAETNSKTVTLTLSATDNQGVTHYCVLENDTGIEPLAPAPDVSCWVPVSSTTSYSANVYHTFTGSYSSGTTVYAYVWFKDAARNVSGVASDGIIYTQTIFSEGFEGGWGTWYADNGVWQVGTPTPGVGPGGCYTGSQCAGTVLDGNYPPNTDSRLVSPTVTLPTVTGFEEVHLRFQNWFSYSTADSGQVQVSVWDPVTSTWGAWVNEGTAVVNTSGWSLKDVDLTAYAGKTVRLAFYHTANDDYWTNGTDVSTGWYIDDVQIVSMVPTFTGDFEAGWGDWGADGGVWQVGTPTAGPSGCYTGSQCAGTELAGTYGPNTDSRLVSPTVTLPTVTGFEEVHLRFQNWFSYSGYDSGQVQVSVWDPVTATWGAWGNEGIPVADTSGWSLKDVDLTVYAGKTIQIAFYHVAGRDIYNHSSESTGWYIDDIVVVKKTPEFTGDFEAGWGDWGADRGVWQVGTPTAGPPGCYTGSQCAGTELAGNYGPNTDSRLISPTVTLPTVTGFEEVHLRFQNWFSYSGYDSGQVQVAVWDPVTSTWGAWVNEGIPVTSISGGWSLKDVPVTAYAGKTVRIAFYHTANDDYWTNGTDVSTGWYIDDVQVLKF